MKPSFPKILLWPGIFLLFFSPLYPQSAIKQEKFPDGVIHYYRVPPPDNRPYLFVEAENLFNVVFSSREKLPFGKSVAFLVGVSKYQYLSPQLPFVENDLEDMRRFLLEQGGFDEVYVANNEAVNRDMIEDYLQNKFFPPVGVSHPLKLAKNDRFLFYYSGHGGDKGGDTGYMQFSGAKPGNFAGDQVLQMKTFQTWCSEIKTDHLLFIFDCCNSGLGFDPTSRSDNSYQQLIATLSRNGSRTLITAGTANEKTFEVKDSRGRGNGVFTRAFLNALESGRADSGRDGFITIDEIMARVKSEIAEFSSRYNQGVTPRDWQLDVNTYRGTFVFVNPVADQQNISLNSEILAITGAKSADASPLVTTVGAYGALRLYTNVSGKVYIDGLYQADIGAGDEIELDRIAVGRHTIEIRSSGETLKQEVAIQKGQTTPLTLRSAAKSSQITPPITTDVSRKVFRDTPDGSFTESDESTMLKKYGFFEIYDNPSGKGFANDYEKQKNGQVVYDRASGLMWQQSGSPNWVTYEDAKKYIAQLNRDGFAGYSDWRLPTLEEAMSLMEREKNSDGLYIDPVFDNPQRWIWTADQPSASRAWLVFFDLGYCRRSDVGYYYNYVRAVRFGQSSR